MKNTSCCFFFMMMVGCVSSPEYSVSESSLNEINREDEDSVFTTPGVEFLNDGENEIPNEACLCHWDIFDQDGVVCLKFVCPNDCATVCSHQVVCLVR